MAATSDSPVHLAIPDSDLLPGKHSNADLTNSLLDPVWRPPAKGWWLLFGMAGTGATIFLALVTYTITTGIGVWGNNIPVAWGFGIINFVWWIGIGHAGTLISAILLLFLQKWRTSINRFSEAMTIFAVMCAGVYPILHTGRPWFTAYWLFPYPNTMRLWPQFKSPLMWDVFAVSTYFTTSVLFWYLGLIPDLAALRDASKNKVARVIYGIFSLGWRGSATEWTHWHSAYMLLAGLATPLVLSVHTIVSFDFAVSLMPGWHTTIFPPYFVAGAVFSGFAMVVTLAVPARRFLNLKHVITEKHLENCNKIILTTSMIVTYGYVMEWFIAFYSGNTFEMHVFGGRMIGGYRYVYYVLLACNVVIPHLFWFKKMRTSIAVMWVVSILVNVGMWTERFIIIVGSLFDDFMPSKWHMFTPTWVDLGLYAGSICFFSTLFLLFLKFLPPVAVAEIKEFNHELKHHEAA